uniref:hypothetical protein n=1 Tax=Burkholderia anthina TaxID=179879 RepID=UPI00158C8EF9|nr:hypothetical protein [Burkholderia anthina]
MEIQASDDDPGNFWKIASIGRLKRFILLNLNDISCLFACRKGFAQTIAIAFQSIPPTIKNTEKI